MADRVLLCLFC